MTARHHVSAHVSDGVIRTSITTFVDHNIVANSEFGLNLKSALELIEELESAVRELTTGEKESVVLARTRAWSRLATFED